MNKGAFIVSRSLFESEIRFKPPEYLKVWIYLCGKANHKSTKYKGYSLNRGQCFVDYDELIKQLEYKIGYRKKQYHDFVMKDLMKRLRSTLMITTVKQPRGVIVSIVNYDKYQVLGNYETTNEATCETTSEQPVNNQITPSINKNDKNDKELKEDNMQFGNFVNLTNLEYQKLVNRFSENKVKDKIERMEYRITNKKKGKSPYTDYYKAIIDWFKKDDDVFDYKKLTSTEIGKIVSCRNVPQFKERYEMLLKNMSEKELMKCKNQYYLSFLPK